MTVDMAVGRHEVVLHRTTVNAAAGPRHTARVHRHATAVHLASTCQSPPPKHRLNVTSSSRRRSDDEAAGCGSRWWCWPDQRRTHWRPVPVSPLARDEPVAKFRIWFGSFLTYHTRLPRTLSEMLTFTVQSVPAITKDIFVWTAGSRRSVNNFHCAV